MKIRRLLTAGIAAGLLVLTGCGSGSSSTPSADNSSSAGGSSSSSDIRIDVITHGAPGDSFWDVVKAGAVQAGKDEGVDLHYQSDPDVGKQATLIDNAVAAGTNGLVVSMANPDGLEKSIKAAVAAGVPVITINSGLDQWQQFGAITHVGQSETLAGKAAGEQLNDAGVKNALCVIQEAGNVGLEQRCAGAAVDVLGGTLTNLQVDNTDLSGSEATIESKIQADPTIDGILTLGGDMSGQAVKAVENTGADITVGHLRRERRRGQERPGRQDPVRHRPAALRAGLPGCHGYLPEGAQRQRHRWWPAGLLRSCHHHQGQRSRRPEVRPTGHPLS